MFIDIQLSSFWIANSTFSHFSVGLYFLKLLFKSNAFVFWTYVFDNYVCHKYLLSHWKPIFNSFLLLVVVVLQFEFKALPLLASSCPLEPCSQTFLL
jgi:hypothetical protein